MHNTRQYNENLTCARNYCSAEFDLPFKFDAAYVAAIHRVDQFADLNVFHYGV